MAWCVVGACVFAASWRLWNITPPNRRQAVSRARWMSLLIAAVASLAPMLLGLVWVSSVVATVTILSVNAVGFLWASAIGDL
jgi:hypothetical protein